MFIQTQATPNPNSVKFLPGKAVMQEGTAEFTQGEVVGSLFISKLLACSGVVSVFLAEDFISITKEENVEWYALKPQVLALIMEQFLVDRPLFEKDQAVSPLTQGPESMKQEDYTTEDWSVVQEIETILAERVRPAVQSDGGDVTLVAFKDGIVYLRMQGACSGCPSAELTLKHGIENMLRYFLPQVQAVEPYES